MPALQITPQSITSINVDLDFGIFISSPTLLATAFSEYIFLGSQTRSLTYDSITVYFNPSYDYADKEDTLVDIIDGKQVAQTVDGLMGAGAKFLDALFYLMIDPDKRPEPNIHVPQKKEGKTVVHPQYRNKKVIAQCMFVYYFMIIIRARALYKGGSKTQEPMPKFIKEVLGCPFSEPEMAEYLASFSLHDVDPRWVKTITVTRLSQESLSRFGLGVAGYRMTTPFKSFAPDRYLDPVTMEAIDEESSPSSNDRLAVDLLNLRGAYQVAQSFATTAPCWDFHPATRAPNLLKKYGNINQNLGNLMLAIYKRKTLAVMSTARMLYQIPVEYPAVNDYKQWSASMVYTPTSPIFPLV